MTCMTSYRARAGYKRVEKVVWKLGLQDRILCKLRGGGGGHIYEGD